MIAKKETLMHHNGDRDNEGNEDIMKISPLATTTHEANGYSYRLAQTIRFNQTNDCALLAVMAMGDAAQ